MSYKIEYASSVASDLAALRAFDRSRILDEIDAQLTHQPHVPTRRRKPLPGLTPPWEHVVPVWELRVGDWRVYYDVSDADLRVVIRAIREKPPHMTTDQTL
jgi:mRNA-degrading endonuclease RelE of RelBE toxin-antitoxin system